MQRPVRVPRTPAASLPAWPRSRCSPTRLLPHTCRGFAVEPKEIKTLYRRFRRLDRAGRGTISTDDLLMIPEISMNPLAPRLTTIFDRDADDRINFRSFVQGLSIFSSNARPEVRPHGEWAVAAARLQRSRRVVHTAAA